MRKSPITLAIAFARWLVRHGKRLSVILPVFLFGVIIAQAIGSGWAYQNGRGEASSLGSVQPGLFSFLGQDDPIRSSRSRDLRQRSEAALEERFKAHEKGLWQAGLNGAKEDHLNKVREAIRDASENDGFGPFAQNVSDGFSPQQGTALGSGEDPGSFRPLQLGVPVGPLFGTLAGQALPITLIDPGTGDGGDEEGEIPEDPTDPENPDPPIVVDPPEPPVSEVPIPGAFLLFPAGLALLARRRQKRSKA